MALDLLDRRLRDLDLDLRDLGRDLRGLDLDLRGLDLDLRDLDRGLDLDRDLVMVLARGDRIIPTPITRLIPIRPIL